MLHHALRAAAGATSTTATSIVQVANLASTWSSGSCTFSSASIGTAATGRLVVVYVCGGVTVAGRVSAVTIGGTSATLAVETTINQFRHNSIWYATINSGTTANIVVTHTVTTNTNPVFISVAAVYDASSTTPVTAFSYSNLVGTSPNQSITLTPQSNAVLYAGYSAGVVAAGTTASWTGATNVMEYIDALSNMMTAATASGLSNTSRTVSVTLTDSSVNRPGIVVATWA